MRWLYHVVARAEPLGDWYAPASLEREGFVHASYADTVAESARLYYDGQDVVVLRIDPRRVEARVVETATPRGPMPHVHGPIPRDAFRVVELDAVRDDRVTGTRYVFVAFDGMTLLDLVGVHDPIARVSWMGIDPTSRCEIVGAQGTRVWSAGGAVLEVARVRPALDEFDVVVVPGGLGTRALQDDAEVIAWLRAFPANRLLASVCTGALLLGAAGRLQGRRATTHASALGQLAGYGAVAVEERVVDEGQLVTAGGVTCALDLGIHLVRRLEGDEAARVIARQMELPQAAGARAFDAVDPRRRGP